MDPNTNNPSTQHTPLHSSPDAPAPPPPEARPLGAEDALSYLEMVRLQLQNEPNVYNHFLEIIKDLGSQAIDAPEAVGRASSLFNGHTTLIQGLSTLLPRGYRIDCGVDQDGRTLITITNPSGTVTQILGDPPLTRDVLPSHVSLTPNPALSHPTLPTATPMLPGSVPANNACSARSNFNKAVDYVNKLEKCLDSDSYKQFLEDIQAYQKGQHSYAEVVQRVGVLLDGQPDLLRDFTSFLPDRNEGKEIIGQSADGN